MTIKGAFPFRSSWNKKNAQYRENFSFGDIDNTEITIWSDWFFTVLKEIRMSVALIN